MVVAGIDIGTTTVCCVLADAERGGGVKTLTARNDSALPPSRPWEEAQDPERIVAIVHELLDACRAEWPQVAAIGISCQMHGIVYVNGDGRHVSPLYTWQDRRGNEPFDDEREGHTYASYLERLTGYRMSPGFGLVTHFYNVRNGLVPEDAAAFCSIGDYAAMRFCGVAAPVTDASNAAGFGLFALDRLAFDAAAVEKAGMDPSLLPKVGGGAIFGTTKDGKPVVCAIGDNQASFLGAVPAIGGSLLFNIGTGAQVSVYSESPADSPKLETRPFPGGGCLLVGASLSGGKSYALLERFFQETCRTFGEDAGPSLYERMNRLAEEALDEGADAPIVGTQFYGTRQQAGATGRIDGLTHRNLTPKHLVLGFLNGIADELLAFVELFPESVRSGISVCSGSGNGIRRNPAMRRILQSRLQLPVQTAKAEEEGAYGAAIHAAVGAGLFADYEAALKAMQA